MSKVYANKVGIRYKVVTLIRVFWVDGECKTDEQHFVAWYRPENPDVLTTTGMTTRSYATAERNLEQVATTQKLEEVLT